MTCKGNTLIDTNALIFLFNAEDKLKEKKKVIKQNIFEIKKKGILYYNLTIFKEFLVGYGDEKEVDYYLKSIEATLTAENKDIMVIAANSHRAYLKDFQELRNNTEELIVKSKTIPNDCVIGATAQYNDLAIMTNNGKDFRKYFPDVKLIEI